MLAITEECKECCKQCIHLGTDLALCAWGGFQQALRVRVGFSAEASSNLAFIEGMFVSTFIMNASGR